MNEINFRDFEMIYFEIKSLFFCLIKRTKNQGVVIVIKAQISIFFEDFRSERFILFTPEMLILSVICCAASSKSLAFQFANKTQQSQGQKGYSELGDTIDKRNKFDVILRGFIFYIKSLFFSLMKRTKNQGYGIVFKAQIPDFLKILYRHISLMEILLSI